MASTSPITASCLCGSIVMTLPDTAPVKSMICYCIDCQKNAGAPFQTNAMFPTSSVQVSDPDSNLKVYTIKETFSGHPKEKWFCGKCGCTTYTKPLHHKGEMVVIKTGLIDGKGTEQYKILAELYTCSRPSYCQPVEGAKQIETMPGK